MSAPYLTTGVHVGAKTELSFRSYPADDRVTVQIGSIGAEVTVFLPRAEIDRLAGVLAEARESLSAPSVKAAA